MLPLVIITFMHGYPSGLVWQTVVLIGAPAIAIGVLLMRPPRIYIYAVLLLFSVVASEFLLNYVDKTIGNFLVFGLPGLAIEAYGFSLLVRFLRRYPRASKEVSDVRG